VATATASVSTTRQNYKRNSDWISINNKTKTIKETATASVSTTKQKL
jgi:hypothetical protein